MHISTKITIFLLILINASKICAQIRKNACKDIFSYLIADFSSNCYYNPDVFADVPEIIKRHVGILEIYKTTTEDGYILTIFRIPRRNPKGVVILHHPVTTDSIIWVGQSDQSFAFLLWRAGYDVWLANNRGTHFSEGHVNMTIHDYKYWDFSFHEIGIYDIKAEIDLVKEKTNSSNIIFVGHSMGTSATIVYAALKPEEAKNSVKLFVEITPTVFFKQLSGGFKKSLFLFPYIRKITGFFKIGDIGRYNSPIMRTLRFLNVHSSFKPTFMFIYFFAFGWTPNEVDLYLLNLFSSHNSRGISWKSLFHYEQLIRVGDRFEMYSYGKEKNLEVYGSELPPEYPLKNITTPMYIVYSEHDVISSVEDSEAFYDVLPPETKIYGKLKTSGLNHVDFHFGKTRKIKVFDKLLNLFDKVTS